DAEFVFTGANGCKTEVSGTYSTQNNAIQCCHKVNSSNEFNIMTTVLVGSAMAA
ncbi:unnamed protein product, partial [Rotaria magnacalcarata]